MAEDDEYKSAERPGDVDTGRVLALSDGVFAIAGTLLVLDLRLPTDLGNTKLHAALANLVPEFRAYAISYALIGLFWYGHHAQFRRIERLSKPVVVLNLVLLGMITLMPFSTQLLSQYGDDRFAVAIYAANMAAILILESAIGAITLRRRDAVGGARAEDMVIRPLTSGLVFLVSVPVGLLTTATAAQFSWLTLVVLGVVRRRVRPALAARRQRNSAS